MAKAHHHTVKELKHDEFAEHMGDMWGFYKRHRNAFWNSVLVVAAAIFLAMVVRGQKARALQESTSLVTQGLDILGSLAPTTETAGYEDAYALFDQAATKYPKTDAGTAAALYRADVRYREGNYQDAGTLYTDFMDAYPEHELAPRALVGVGRCLQAQGDPERAVLHYREFLDKYPDNYLKTEVELALAGAYEEAGDLDAAREALEAMVAGDLDPAYKSEAEARLSSLGALPPQPDLDKLRAEAEARSEEPETPEPPAGDEPETE